MGRPLSMAPHWRKTPSQGIAPAGRTDDVCKCELASQIKEPFLRRVPRISPSQTLASASAHETLNREGAS